MGVFTDWVQYAHLRILRGYINMTLRYNMDNKR